MAKIGTAHVEIKPVVNEDALTALCLRIQQQVEDAVQRGLESAHRQRVHIKPADPVQIALEIDRMQREAR